MKRLLFTLILLIPTLIHSAQKTNSVINATEMNKKFPLVAETRIDGKHTFEVLESLNLLVTSKQILSDTTEPADKLKFIQQDSWARKTFKNMLDQIHLGKLPPRAIEEFQSLMINLRDFMSNFPMSIYANFRKLQITQMPDSPPFYQAYFAAKTPQERTQVLLLLLAIIAEGIRVGNFSFEHAFEPLKEFINEHASEITIYGKEQIQKKIDDLEELYEETRKRSS